MLENRIFRNALFISIAIHGLFFFNWPPLKNFVFFKPAQELKVTYYPSTKKMSAPLIPQQISQKEKINLPMPQAAKPAKPVLKTASEDKVFLKAREIEHQNAIRAIKKDTQPLITHQGKDFSKEPTYLNYYHAIREKINQVVTANKPALFKEGQVRIVFTVARDGRLLSANIINEVSTQNPTLRSYALNSINRAAPFTPFLASMKENDLTLYLTISFEK